MTVFPPPLGADDRAKRGQVGAKLRLQNPASPLRAYGAPPPQGEEGSSQINPASGELGSA